MANDSRQFTTPQMHRDFFTPEFKLDLTNISAARLYHALGAKRRRFPYEDFPALAGDYLAEIEKNNPGIDALGPACCGATLSAAIQPLIDVKLPWGDNLIRPISFYALMAAGFGQRKSTLEELLARPLIDLAAKWYDDYLRQSEAYDLARPEWICKFKILNQAKAKAKTAEDILRATQQLNDHYDIEPKKPKLRPLLVTDMTLRSLAEGFEGRGGSLTWWTDEGVDILFSILFKLTGRLNNLFDGKFLPVKRGHNKFFVAHDPRFTIGIFIQSEILILIDFGGHLSGGYYAAKGDVHGTHDAAGVHQGIQA
jgi:hypothetical protein